MTRFQRLEKLVRADPNQPIEIKIVGWGLMIEGTLIFFVGLGLWLSQWL